jgi:dUTP pyrophosphatase
MNTLNVRVKRVKDTATIPKYATYGDAGVDLVAVSKHSDMMNMTVTYDTGLAVEIPEGYVGLVFPRSSVRKYDLQLSNSVGVIDSGYRGTIQFTFRVLDVDSPKMYEVGDRIGQLIILPYPIVNFMEVDELSDTVRGEGGFGSTGA